MVEYFEKKFKGKKVVVARGRKVPKGTTGTCFWIGSKPIFKHNGYQVATQYKCGVKDSNGSVYWTDPFNLELA